VILDPVNDGECLGQLTKIARELARTTMAYNMAARLRTRRGVIRWLQSLPQSDDDGREKLQWIACDVPQRTRTFPSDPNCFERTIAALALLEVIDPKTPRVAVTIDYPARHTGVVELLGDEWEPLDVFPRRNASDFLGVSKGTWQDVFGGVHQVGGFILGDIYGQKGAVKALEKQEQDWGLLKKPPPKPPQAAPKPAPQPAPKYPPAGPPVAQPAQPQPQQWPPPAGYYPPPGYYPPAGYYPPPPGYYPPMAQLPTAPAPSPMPVSPTAPAPVPTTTTAQSTQSTQSGGGIPYADNQPTQATLWPPATSAARQEAEAPKRFFWG
jgi:hypothetical protein